MKTLLKIFYPKTNKMRYLIFHTKTEYEQGTIEKHINYLQLWSGSPNCWDSFDDLMEAMEEAKYFHETEGCRVVVYDDESERVVHNFKLQD